MSKWLVKAAIQGTISLLPRPHLWNGLLQRYVTHTDDIDEDWARTKWARAERHIANFVAEAGDHAEPPVVLELGTGWHPVVPIALSLLGVSRAWTIDASSLLSRDRVLHSMKLIAGLLDRGEVVARHEGRLERFRAVLAEPDYYKTATALLMELEVFPLVGDARHTGLGASAIDLFVSNNTLSHIPPAILRDILAEFRRLSSSRAVMSHFLDMSDQYSVFDSSITKFNFLRFDGRMWKFFNNRLQYVNRLRVADFRDLNRETGWTVCREDNAVGSPDEIAGLPIASEFQHYSQDDLLAYESWMTSTPASV